MESHLSKGAKGGAAGRVSAVYTSSTMDGQIRGFPFRWFLPLTQLLVCISILWPYWLGEVQEAWDTVHGRAHVSSPELPPGTSIDIDVPPMLRRQLDWFEVRMKVPAALNLPVGIVQLPYVIANPAKTEWVPKGMFFQTWRAISWPFLGVVFWWMAGRGVEALVAARWRAISPRIRWIEVAFGLLMLVLGAGLCISLLGRGIQARPGDSINAAGGALWALLGAVAVTARILQWRIRRSAKRQDGAVVSAA